MNTKNQLKQLNGAKESKLMLVIVFNIYEMLNVKWTFIQTEQKREREKNSKSE